MERLQPEKAAIEQSVPRSPAPHRGRALPTSKAKQQPPSDSTEDPDKEQSASTKQDDSEIPSLDTDIPVDLGGNPMYDPTNTIKEPNDLDCLFGRGKPFQMHAGNKRFLNIIDQFKARYLNAKRGDKHPITAELVKIVKTNEDGGPPIRFLKRICDIKADAAMATLEAQKNEIGGTEAKKVDPADRPKACKNINCSCGWVEVDDNAAMIKVSHTLRSRWRRAEAGLEPISNRAPFTPGQPGQFKEEMGAVSGMVGHGGHGGPMGPMGPMGGPGGHGGPPGGPGMGGPGMGGPGMGHGPGPAPGGPGAMGGMGDFHGQHHEYGNPDFMPNGRKRRPDDTAQLEIELMREEMQMQEERHMAAQLERSARLREMQVIQMRETLANSRGGQNGMRPSGPMPPGGDPRFSSYGDGRPHSMMHSSMGGMGPSMMSSMSHGGYPYDSHMGGLGGGGGGGGGYMPPPHMGGLPHPSMGHPSGMGPSYLGGSSVYGGGGGGMPGGSNHSMSPRDMYARSLANAPLNGSAPGGTGGGPRPGSSAGPNGGPNGGPNSGPEAGNSTDPSRRAGADVPPSGERPPPRQDEAKFS